jgi:hypothetical protein
MFIRIVDGEPEDYGMTQLRRDNPHTSFPIEMTDAELASYGVFRLNRVAEPSYDPLRSIVRGAKPTQVNGKWTQQWEVLPLPTSTQLDNLKAARAQAFAAEADPLFFKAHRGEATMDEWSAKIQEIRDRFPYPEE